MTRLDTENAASLHQQRQQMYEAIDRYRNSFVDPLTGLLRADRLEQRACPVCGGTAQQRLFIKNGGQYMRCGDCAMVFLNPVFTDAALADYYRHNNAAQAIAHESEAAFYRRIYGVGLDLVQRYVGTGDVLDIGCSGGLFLDVARERGWKTFGIELNEQEVVIAQGKDHQVWNCEIADLPVDRRFALISLWDVFEHIKDGVGYLRMLAGLLAPGGLVFMQIPSADSLAARIMREQCNVFDGLEHVNLYGEVTIGRTAERAGYEIVAVESVIDELKPLMNFLGYEHPYQGSFQPQPRLDFLTPEVLHHRKLGYKLQVLMCLR
ncbi:class I SAM-dependent methyltransferase [Acidovorax lacteus]|uniref:Class I SAM-dependent methyltransferase n=1 Tax=Acidovorax lacteus TaxID=1924988 RepID=A0ABP8LH95_9BURK